MKNKNALSRLAAVVLAVLAIALVTVRGLFGHDLFLKPEAFLLASNSEVELRVLNGTFTTSEASVTRERLRDLTLAGPSGLTRADTNAWEAVGKESRWKIRVGAPGTYVAGASLFPRVLGLSAKDFNAYLAEDGIADVLAERQHTKELDQPARERYSKHVKAIVSVEGSSRSNSDTAFRTQFGYPAELVPIDNPYVLRSGAMLRVRALVDGAPIANQLVLAGGHTSQGVKIVERRMRTDSTGVARVSLRSSGVWYVKFIRMKRVEPGAADSVDYESKWATLTFAVR